MGLKISELTDGGVIQATDQLATNRGGVNRRVVIGTISTAPITFPFTAGQSDPLIVGDGQGMFVVPACMNGMNIVSALAVLRTAGTTGTTDFQLRRRRAGADVDVLSTKLTVDSAEATSATAAAAAVVNTANDDLATGDLLYLDIDAVSTTPPQGGGAVFEARFP
jgi:hypothetical protein